MKTFKQILIEAKTTRKIHVVKWHPDESNVQHESLSHHKFAEIHGDVAAQHASDYTSKEHETKVDTHLETHPVAADFIFCTPSAAKDVLTGKHSYHREDDTHFATGASKKQALHTLRHSAIKE